jgi:hypothetical protein
MKKHIFILITIVFLLSCESEKDPCNIEYKLNEPGGFGRNEVTFLIDDETVWYSKGSGVSTGGGFFGGPTSGEGSFSIKRRILWEDYRPLLDSLGNYIYDVYYGVSFITTSSTQCGEHKTYNSEIRVGFSQFNFEKNDCGYVYFTMSSKIGTFSNRNSIIAKVYINRIDSICYGSFSGVLYSSNSKDSLIISSGTFDFKYDEIQYEEIKN